MCLDEEPLCRYGMRSPLHALVAPGTPQCCVAVGAAQCTRKGDGCPGVGMRAHLGVGPVIRPRQQHGAGPDKAAEVVHVMIRGPVLMHPLHSSAAYPVSGAMYLCPGGVPFAGVPWAPHQQAGGRIFPHALCSAESCSEGFSRDGRAKRHLDRSLLGHTTEITAFACKSCICGCSLFDAMKESDCCASPWAARGPS